MIRAAKWLLDLLFPPKCVFCHALLVPGAQPVCDQCAAQILRMEPLERDGEFYDRCVSALPYEEPVRSSVLRYKFSGRQEYAQTYASLLAACVREKLTGRFDLVSWVPVSRRRRRQRGYDQAELLGAPAEPCLRKTRHNRAQSSLHESSARKANVLGAYCAYQPAHWAGKHILLIDDVVTTGATLEECSRVLQTAGAAGVCCATLAARPGKG